MSPSRPQSSNSFPSPSHTDTRVVALQRRWLTLCVATLATSLCGCELLVDFDRDRIPSSGTVVDNGPFEGDDPDGGSPDDNHPPIANDDKLEAQVGRVLLVSSSAGILKNDTDPDGDELTAKLVGDDVPGLFVMDDGSLKFIPELELAADESTDVTFDYVANDGEVDSEPATVTIHVVGSSEPIPEAIDDEYELFEDEVLRVNAAEGVGANDRPASDNAPLHYQALDMPEAGTLELEEDGSFVYTPATDSQSLNSSQTTVVTFSYLAADDEGRGDRGLVTITIRGSNDLPTIVDATAVTAPHTELIAEPGTLQSYLTDPDGDDLTITAAENQSSERGGTVSIASDGSYRYLPPVNVSDDTDSFNFEVSDGTATITIMVDVELIGSLIWFVDNSFSGDSDGRSTTPFTTLAEAQAASAPGHTIYVRATDTSYGPIDLKANQRLLGSGLPLTVQAAGGAPVPVVAATSAATLTGPVNLSANCEVGGIAIEGSASHGVRGASIETGYLHDIQIDATGTHGIHLLDVGGLFRVERVTIDSPGENGISIEDSSATVDIRDTEVIDALRQDANPSAGLGVNVNSAGLLLQNNSGAFTWTGGEISWSRGNRLPAIKATDITSIRLEGRTDDNRFEVRGAGKDVSSGIAPPAILIANASTVTVRRLQVHELVHASEVAAAGAIYLENISDEVTLENNLIGTAEGGLPVVGPGIVVNQGTTDGPLALTLAGNRLASPEGGGLTQAISVEYSGTQTTSLQAEIADQQIVGAAQALVIDIAGSGDATERNDIQISELSASGLLSLGIEVSHGGGASSRVEISGSTLAGQDTAVSGIVVSHAGSALDLIVADNEITDFTEQALIVNSNALGCRALLSGNTLLADGETITSNGAGILLRSLQGQTLDATVVDNSIRWPQHSLLARGESGARLCLDARDNSGENADDAPSNGFFFGDIGDTASLTMAFSQPTEAELQAANNDVGLLVFAASEFSATCAEVE